MHPLAERLRPKTLDEFVNQEHLVGKDGVIRKMIENDSLVSMILWGPPGTGKTTLAHIIARQTQRQFYKLNAIDSGVKQIREIIASAEKNKFFNKKTPILFIDEIHRFSKSQQDSLLEAVEKGIVILIGSTTENPSYEVISPLLSRCQVYILKALDDKDLDKLLNRAINSDVVLSTKKFEVKEKEALFRFSAGDARKLLNILEILFSAQQNQERIVIDNETVIKILQTTSLQFDKKGDWHYDIISAFIKSVRGSDPDAAIYWLARMFEAGEDIKFIARRLIILAAEDIGLANPNALLLATETFKAVETVGMPEARIILAETTIYLALSPKSNSAYKAINTAMEFVKKTGNLKVPLHMRNANTNLEKQLGYGADYLYPHDYPENFVFQQYLPAEIKDKRFYFPQENKHEKKFKDFLKKFWNRG